LARAWLTTWGLGKTIQVLSLLLVLKSQTDGTRRPNLLVAPASLLANWASEVERFAPSLKTLIAHPSAMSAADLKTFAPERLRDLDLVITSYGSLLRIPWIAETAWQLVVLDEAQAIKNPDAKQARTAKKLKAQSRFALTGTPIENRLGDLWSIFRLHQPWATRVGKGIYELHQAPCGPTPQSIRPFARTGTTVHLAKVEDRQNGDRRPARQNRGQGVLPAQPENRRRSISKRSNNWRSYSKTLRVSSGRV
jgi:hypothetical protein